MTCHGMMEWRNVGLVNLGYASFDMENMEKLDVWFRSTNTLVIGFS